MARPTDRPKTDPVRATTARSATKSTTETPGIGVWAWEWVKSIGMALILFLVIRTFLFQTFTVISGSMEKTLLVSDWLVLNKVAYGANIPLTSKRLPGYSEIKRHDIVVFRPPHDPTIDVVKRIIGMPGDTLAMHSQILYIDGKVANEPFVQHTDPTHDDAPADMLWQRNYVTKDVNVQGYHPSRDNWGPIVVPAGHYFMMGDNRDESLDSRWWGFLEAIKIKGRASFIYYSYDSDVVDPFPWIRDIRWNRIGSMIR